MGASGTPKVESTVVKVGLDYATGVSEVPAGAGVKPVICDGATDPEPITNEAYASFAMVPCEPDRLTEVLQSSIKTHYTGYINVYAWEDIDPNKYYSAMVTVSNMSTGKELFTKPLSVLGSKHAYEGRQFASVYYDYTLPADEALAIYIDFEV